MSPLWRKKAPLPLIVIVAPGPEPCHHSGDVRSIFDPVAAVSLFSNDLLRTILLDLIVQRQERRNDLRVEDTEPGGTYILLLKNG